MLELFGGMINGDDPRHARLRRIVPAAFNPRVIRSVEGTIAAVAAAVADRLTTAGECDFVTEVPARLPLQIMYDMMGVATVDHQRVFACSNVILSADDPEHVAEGSDVVGAFLQTGAELSELMQDPAPQRNARPTDDVTSALLNANVTGESLSHVELASFFILLVVAGNETTRNTISHGLWALSEHPDPHVGFGAPGPHSFLGAHLARREITVMFRERHRRVPQLGATGEPGRLRSSFVNRIKHLPCAVDALEPVP